MICAWTVTSRAVVGSSQIRILRWQDSAMALNFMQGDLERTTYLYFVDGKLQCQGGWFGDDIGLASGRATTFRNLPIPVRHTQLNP